MTHPPRLPPALRGAEPIVAARRRAAVSMNALRRLVWALRASDAESRRAHGVGTAQLFVLRHLGGPGAVSVGELADRTATSPSAVSEVVSRLAARGLVTRGRSGADRRRAALTLTAAGREMLAAAPAAPQQDLIDGFYRLPPDTQRSLASGLAAWLDESGLAELPANMFFEAGAEE